MVDLLMELHLKPQQQQASDQNVESDSDSSSSSDGSTGDDSDGSDDSASSDAALDTDASSKNGATERQRRVLLNNMMKLDRSGALLPVMPVVAHSRHSRLCLINASGLLSQEG